MSQDGTLVAERELSDAGRRHAQTLLAEIDAACAAHRLKARDIGAVAVSVGPGSFTGLRVGVVFAKTLSYAIGCRLIAVDTLLAVAEQSPSDVDCVWVLSDAQRGDVYAARYRRVDATRWDVAESIRIRPAAEWLAERTLEEIVSGPGVDRLDAAEVTACGLRILAPEIRSPRSATIARIGFRQLEQGQIADPWNLEPFYLRKPAAEEKLDVAAAGT